MGTNLRDALGVYADMPPMHSTTAVISPVPMVSNDSARNGTATLLKFDDVAIAVTSNHVVQYFEENLSTEPSLQFQLSNVPIDIEKLIISRDVKWDLAVIDLSNYEEADFKSRGNKDTNYYHPPSWPPKPVKPGDIVIGAGYPGIWRQFQSTNHFVGFTFAFSADVSSVSETAIFCEPNLDSDYTEFSEALRNHVALPANPSPEELLHVIDFGGISGGPVFIHRIRESSVSRIEFVGFIESFAFGVVRVIPAKALSSSGMLADWP